MKNMVNAGLGVLAIGGVMIAIYQVRVDIQERVPAIGNDFFRLMLFVAILLSLGAILMIVLAFAHHLMRVRRSMDYVRRVVADLLRDPIYDCRPAGEDELDAVRNLGAMLIDEQISPIEDMREWHRKNPALFFVVEEISVRRQTREIVGYFSLLPVNKRTADLLEKGKITGIGLTPEHIVTSNGKPAAVYVGGIAAKSPRARAYALASLIARLDAQRRDTDVYSRPVTERGLQLLKKYNFVPVKRGHDKLGDIFKATRHVRNVPRKRRRRGGLDREQGTGGQDGQT